MLVLTSVLCTVFGVAVGFGPSPNAWKEDIVGNWDTVNKTTAFEDWKSEFNKQYANAAEEAVHFETFLLNWKRISEFNVAGNESYTLRLNQFGDLNEEEFKVYVHGHNGSCLRGDRRKRVVSDSSIKLDAPESVDWTNVSGKSYVSAVKNQGSCGSCWAFSTTGSIESRASILNNMTDGEIITLSEQELVDCSGAYGNKGCEGGLMDNAFKYVEDNKGLCSEKEYPYTGKDGSCQASQCTKRYDLISNYSDVTTDSFPALEAAVAQGPVSIAIQANTFPFQFYHDGVFSGKCGTELDHGVLAVGYGETGGQKWWKVKNSWGDSWGMDGYILICRECGKNGKDGECGLLMEPSYPDPVLNQ